jgi:hypothetical protein
MMSTMIRSNLTAAPERLTVPTCFGCGSMARDATCEHGCHEQSLDLVRAAAYDELVSVRVAARACVDAFRPIVEELAWRQPEAGHAYELAYRTVQERARAALRSHPVPAHEDDVMLGAAEPASTWWCDECGALEARQPCLEVCIWREVDWVRATSYEAERGRTLSELALESRLRTVLSRVAWVTPLEGEWLRCWRVLRADARAALDVPPERSAAAAAS